MGAGIRLSLLGLALLIARPVSAQADEPQNDAPQTRPRSEESPPDVVLLKSGGMVRGTISEMDPGGEVVIRLANGNLRSFPMTTVEFAGPKEKMPIGGPPRPASGGEKPVEQPGRFEPGVYGGGVPVNLRANLPEVTFHLKTGTANFEGIGPGWSANGGLLAVAVSGTASTYSVICTAPCTATLPPGTHRIALSLDGGKSVEAEQAVVLGGPTRVEGTYTSNSGIRTAGWIIAIAGGLAGIGIMVAAYPSSDTEEPDDGNPALALAGTGVLLGAAITGGIMVSVDDDAEVQASPTVAKRHPRPRHAALRWQGAGFSF